MSDTAAAMHELGLLEEKRQQHGLSAEEDARYAQLLAHVGQTPETGGWAPAPQQWAAPHAQGYDPNAQQWDPNAQPYDPNAQQWDPNAQGYGANAQQWDPNAQPYDPNAQQWDPNAQPYDPSAQQWDPNAQPYDLSAQQWDPNAQPYDLSAQQWDPNAQPYDPSAQQWDPNAQPYDPNAQQWDPNAQPYDPNAQQWDPNAQPYDPNAQPYDPNAQQWDPNAQPYDPNAQQWDPNAQPYAPNAQQWDPNAQPYDPNAQQWDPNAQPYDPNAQPYDPSAQQWDPNAQPYDANAHHQDPNALYASTAQPYDPNVQAYDALGPPQDAHAQQWDPNAQAYAAEAPQWQDPSLNARPEDALPAWPGYELKPDPSHAWLSEGTAAPKSPWVQPSAADPALAHATAAPASQASVPDGSASLSLSSEVDLPGLESTPDWMKPSPVPTEPSGSDATGDALSFDSFGDEPARAGSEALGISPLSAPISTPLPDQAELLDRAVSAGADPSSRIDVVDAMDVSDADIMEVSDDDVSLVDDVELIAEPVTSRLEAPATAVPPPSAVVARPTRTVRIGGASTPGGAAAVDALTSTIRGATPSPGTAALGRAPLIGGGFDKLTAPAVVLRAESASSELDPQEFVLDAGDFALEASGHERPAHSSDAVEAAAAPSVASVEAPPPSQPLHAEFTAPGTEGVIPDASFEPPSNDAQITEASPSVESHASPAQEFEPVAELHLEDFTADEAGQSAPDRSDAPAADLRDDFAERAALEIDLRAQAVGQDDGANAGVLSDASGLDSLDDAPGLELDANDVAAHDAGAEIAFEINAHDAAADIAVDLEANDVAAKDDGAEIALELDAHDVAAQDDGAEIALELDAHDVATPDDAAEIELDAHDVAAQNDGVAEITLELEAHDLAVTDAGIAFPVALESQNVVGSIDTAARPIDLEALAPATSNDLLAQPPLVDATPAAPDAPTAFAHLSRPSHLNEDAPTPVAPSHVQAPSTATEAPAPTPAIDSFVDTILELAPADAATIDGAANVDNSPFTAPPPASFEAAPSNAEEELQLEAVDALELAPATATIPAEEEAPLPAEMFEPLVPETIVPEEQLAYAPQPLPGEIELTEDPRVLDVFAHSGEIELQEISLGDGVSGEIAAHGDSLRSDRRVIDDLDLSGDAEDLVPLAPASDFITADASGRQAEVLLPEATDVVIASSSLAELANVQPQQPLAETEADEIELELDGVSPEQPRSGEIELNFDIAPAPAHPITGEIDLASTVEDSEEFEEIELTGPLASPSARVATAPRTHAPDLEAEPQADDAEALVSIELSSDDVDGSETIELGAADVAAESPAPLTPTRTAPSVPLPFLGTGDGALVEPVVSDSVEIELDLSTEAPEGATGVRLTPRAEVTRFADQRSTPPGGSPIRVQSDPQPSAPSEETELELELDEADVEEGELELELADVELEAPVGELEAPEIELQAQELEIEVAPARAPVPLIRSVEPPPVMLTAADAPRPPPATLTPPRGAPAQPAPLDFDFSHAAPSSSSYVVGEHRVILHTSEGHVKRGILRDVDLLSPEIPLFSQAGQPPESIAQERVKAIFFMLTAGDPPPPPDGAKIRITFNDGRQVAGFASGHRSGAGGFFVVPADNRTNTARIFVYRPSVQAVFEG